MPENGGALQLNIIIYSGDYTEEKKPAPEFDVYETREYRDKPSRTSLWPDDAPVRPDTHRERDVSRTPYSHYTYTSIVRRAESGRWPAARPVLGNIHTGLLKTLPKYDWFANTKKQPIKIPCSNKRCPGVHISTWTDLDEDKQEGMLPTGEKNQLETKDPSGRSRYVLQDAEVFDFSWSNQLRAEGAKRAADADDKWKDIQVPFTVVSKEVWDKLVYEECVWRDGVERVGRGLVLMDEDGAHGLPYLLLRRGAVRVSGLHCRARGWIRAYPAHGGVDWDRLPAHTRLDRSRQAWVVRAWADGPGRLRPDTDPVTRAARAAAAAATRCVAGCGPLARADGDWSTVLESMPFTPESLLAGGPKTKRF